MGLRFLSGFGFRGGGSFAMRGMMTPPLPRRPQLARSNALCEVKRRVAPLMQGTRDGWSLVGGLRRRLLCLVVVERREILGVGFVVVVERCRVERHPREAAFFWGFLIKRG